MDLKRLPPRTEVSLSEVVPVATAVATPPCTGASNALLFSCFRLLKVDRGDVRKLGKGGRLALSTCASLLPPPPLLCLRPGDGCCLVTSLRLPGIKEKLPFRAMPLDLLVLFDLLLLDGISVGERVVVVLDKQKQLFEG